MKTALIHLIYSDDHKIKEALEQFVPLVVENVQSLLKLKAQHADDNDIADDYGVVTLIPMPLNFTLGRLAQNRVDVEIVVYAGYCEAGAKMFCEQLHNVLSRSFAPTLRVRAFMRECWETS